MKTSIIVHFLVTVLLTGISANADSCSAHDYDCHLIKPFLSLEYPRAKKYQPISPNSLPDEIKKTVNQVNSLISSRRFANTNYRAYLERIYRVYRTNERQELVGYTVIGAGSGEPDYNERLIYSIDTTGAQQGKFIFDY